MPTTAEHPSHGVRTFQSFHSPSHSWTDDLPVCHDSAVGFSTNQIYREDGALCKNHEFEDKSFHFRPGHDICLYGVFDGHEGILASHFAAQRLPAELLLGQLDDKKNDSETKEILRQALEAVERGFFDSIDDKLAEIANLKIELPDGLKPFDVYQQYPELVRKLELLNAEIAGGTTAVVALIHHSKLFVANVGDSRALLIKKEKSTNQLEVLQLSIDHDIKNEDELLRLLHLGLDIDKLRTSSKLGNQENTRCIGNYQVKGGYKDFESLSSAVSEPVIAEPEVIGGIPIDESCMFMLLMSYGFYKTLESAMDTTTTNTNAKIANLVLDQFNIQSTLPGVAQGAVDKVVRLHHDKYMNSCYSTSGSQARSSGFENYRDDITLMVRNFNMPLRNVRPSGVTLMSQVDEFRYSTSNSSNQETASYEATCGDSNRTISDEGCATNSDTQDSSINPPEFFPSQNLSGQLSIDEDGRIASYVNFTEYYDAVEEAEKQGIDVFLDADLVEGWKNNEIGVIME